MYSENWLHTFRMVARLYDFAQTHCDTEDHAAHEAELRKRRQEFLDSLSQLEEILDGKPYKRGMDRLPMLFGFRPETYVPLDAKMLRRLEKLAARLWTASGTGRTSVEEALLGQIALAADEASLPFFRAALEANRPRDVFQLKRRRMAMAAIAFLAEVRGSAGAYDQLRRHLRHKNPAVRVEAVVYFAQIHLAEDGGLKAEAAQTLVEIAQKDRAFGPRYLARGFLAAAGQDVSLEPPNGVYAFQIALGRAWRTIELTSSQTLGQLAHAILRAFNWDHDHLYEFAMTSDLADSRFVLSASASDMPFFSAVSPEEDTEPSVMELPIGALGLTQGHEFLFRYDFGDDHRFRVLVAAVYPHKERRIKYPRIVAQSGKAPAQYQHWEERL